MRCLTSLLLVAGVALTIPASVSAQNPPPPGPPPETWDGDVWGVVETHPTLGVPSKVHAYADAGIPQGFVGVIDLSIHDGREFINEAQWEAGWVRVFRKFPATGGFWEVEGSAACPDPIELEWENEDGSVRSARIKLELWNPITQAIEFEKVATAFWYQPW